MAFNQVITVADDADALIPEEISDAIIRDMTETGWLFGLARELPRMSTDQERMPVLSALPTASFVDGEAGLIETEDVSWENKYVDAAKVGIIVPITQEVLDDSAYPIWEQVQPLIVEAANIAISRGVLYGTGIPASWQTNLGSATGIVGFATAASQTASIADFTDLYEAMLGESADGASDGLVSLLEADGFFATGTVAHPTMRSRIRNARDADGQRLTILDDDGGFSGAPIIYPMDDSIAAATSLAIAGDWRKLVYAWRSDMRFDVATEGVITDAAGKVIINLFQQDMAAMRILMRLGFALPNPINRMQETEASRSPFAVLTA